MVDRSQLLKQTASFLKENNLTSFDFCDELDSFTENNPFMIIINACLGYFDEKEARKIKKQWDNQEQFRYQVFKELFTNKAIIVDGNKRTIFIYMQKSIWNRMEIENTTKNSDGRRFFLVNFCDHIGALMRQFDIKCWPKNRYNYLTKANGHKNPNYWSGVFDCRNEDCDIMFRLKSKKGPLTSYDDVIIEVEWENDCNHEDYERKPIISRKNRKEIAGEIALNGLGNVIASNIIENAESDPLISISQLYYTTFSIQKFIFLREALK